VRNFDSFIGIDWSGAKSPIKSKAIAVATCSHGKEAPTLISQRWSREDVSDYIQSLLGQGKRTLIGIDCNFGYAAQTIEKQFGKDATAANLWQKVEELNTHHMNFFAGDFFSHPDYAPYFWTEGKMPENFTMPQRMTETQCAKDGLGRPESPFKLIGAKQVGKGGLAGMRLAHSLKQNQGDKIAIWPFDSIALCDKAEIIITEIYPRQFIKRAGFGDKKIRDCNGVNIALKNLDSLSIKNREISDHQTDALISAAGLRHLCGNDVAIPESLATPPAPHPILQKEGWIFGVGHL
jgi:hypothetical protein